MGVSLSFASINYKLGKPVIKKGINVASELSAASHVGAATTCWMKTLNSTSDWSRGLDETETIVKNQTQLSPPQSQHSYYQNPNQNSTEPILT